jgi:hypothetical protein
LAAAFRPDEKTCQLRAYLRQRANVVRQASRHVQHMQKALEQMNLKLTEILSDITGVTGRSILRAILRGTRAPEKLAQYRDKQCKASEAQIAQVLTGSYREEHLFELKLAYQAWQFSLKQVEKVDTQVALQLGRMRVPLSTLRCRPRDRQRMTRGRDGWLGLSRVTLAFTTPRRSPGALPVQVNHDPVRLTVAALFLDQAVKPLAAQVFQESERTFEGRANRVGLLIRFGHDPGLEIVAVPKAEFEHNLGLLLGRLDDLLPRGVQVGHGDLPGTERSEVEIRLDGGIFVLIKLVSEYMKLLRVQRPRLVAHLVVRFGVKIDFNADWLTDVSQSPPVEFSGCPRTACRSLTTG